MLLIRAIPYIFLLGLCYSASADIEFDHAYLYPEEEQASESKSTSAPETDIQIQKLIQDNQVYEKVIRNLIDRIERLEASTKRTAEKEKGENNISEEKTDPAVRAKLEKESMENSTLINSAFEQRLSKEGGMLLKKGQLIYEPGFSFMHSSYDKVVIDGFTVFPVLVVGDITSEKLKRDIFTINNSFRYGIGNDMQVDILIPFGSENEKSFREDGTHEEKDVSGLGDITLGISYQFLKSHSSWPDTLFSFNIKTKTGDDPYRVSNSNDLAMGSGFTSYGLSLTTMSNADPVVLFGGLSTNYTESENKEIGVIKPGMSHGINLGMALALNFDISLSFNFQYQHSSNTEIDGISIAGSDITTSTLAIGLSVAKGKSYSVDLDLGIGLTADSPDFQFTASFPLNYAF